MYGAYYWGQPYYGQANNVDESLLIRHFWRFASKTIDFDHLESTTLTFDNAESKTLSFDKDL